MHLELVALGGAVSRAKKREKRAPIGGSAILVKYGKIGFLSDCGAYQARGKQLEQETEKILWDYRRIGNGEYKLPIINDLNYLHHEDTLLPANSDSILPDFEILNEIEKLVIFLHHGHFDHVGGLPVLRKMLAGKGIKPLILASSPTRNFCKWAWNDQLKQMREKGQRPGYDKGMMFKLLKEIKIINHGETVHFGPFEINPIHSGHILGALSALVKIAGKKLFFTSDISFDDYLIAGAQMLCKNDVGNLDCLISEFTYGGRKKENIKEKEIKRLKDDVRNTLRAGGKILIPALSIARVPTIFKALEHAGIVQRWPVYINGYSSKINANIYINHGIIDYKILRHFVRSRNESYKIAHSKKPCVMIAPAGMMAGGWSVYYGSKWASNSKNLIALTCFQVPGSPGFRLLKMKKGSEIKLGNEDIILRAKVKKYALSAHASGKELEQMFDRLAPKKIFLVHGEERQIDNFVINKPKAEKMIVGKKYRV